MKNNVVYLQYDEQSMCRLFDSWSKNDEMLSMELQEQFVAGMERQKYIDEKIISELHKKIISGRVKTAVLFLIYSIILMVLIYV
jgi:hypothetical protein